MVTYVGIDTRARRRTEKMNVAANMDIGFPPGGSSVDMALSDNSRRCRTEVTRNRPIPCRRSEAAHQRLDPLLGSTTDRT
jgi:hypothetical protein